MRFRAAALGWMLLPSAIFSQSAPAERGRAEFKTNCGFCHGDDATGNRAPDLIRSLALSHDRDGDVLTPILREGRPAKGMPGFAKLDAARISDIVAFLHARADAAYRSSDVPADYPLAKLRTGNADAGKMFFLGAGGCSHCHSITGDLAGIARKYTPLELQQRMLSPPEAPAARAVVHGADGTVIEGVLVHEDEFEISIRDKNGRYRSWPRERVRVEISDPLQAHREMMTKYTDADIHNLFAFLASRK